MLPIFAQVAEVSPPDKASVLEQGLERLLLHPIGAGLLASLLGLTVLRARAGYLKGSPPP